MGRKRNADSGAKGNDPVCPAGHTLRRRVADGDYECDACSMDLSTGCCFYGCEPCDYSLCGSCYVKLATGTMEQSAQQPGQEAAIAAGAMHSNHIDPDVADLCDHYAIEDRIMLLLNEAMKERQSTFTSDMQGLWEALAAARSPAGLLMAKIRHMKEGTFVGKVEAPPEVKRVVKQYRLDDDAKNKLTDFILKRPNTAKEDLWEIERRLEGSGRPSAVVMTMIVAIQRGGKLPEMRTAAPHRDYGELSRSTSSAAGGGGGGAGGGGAKESSSSRSHRELDRRRSRSRDREKDRDRDRDRGEKDRGEKDRR